MVGIEGRAIGIRAGEGAIALLRLLVPVMAGLAKGLRVIELEEPLPVAFVRLHMVNDCRWCYSAKGGAKPAEWFGSEPLGAQAMPCCEFIPASPCLCLLAALVGHGTYTQPGSIVR